MTDGVILNPGSGGPTVDTETNAGRANAQMQRMKLVLGDIDTDAGDVSLANPVPVGFSAVNYTYSTVNTTTAQLAQGATWTGTIESALNQPAISLLCASDQNGILTVNQFIDLAGTRPLKPIQFMVAAGVGLGVSFPLNGNYVQISFLNVGIGPTTTLNINTAYGAIEPATSLGNAPIALNEIGGQPINLNVGMPVNIEAVNGQPAPSGQLPTNDANLAAATTPDSPIFTGITGSPGGDYAGVPLIETLMQPDSGEAISARIVNPVKTDVNNATIISDAPVNIGYYAGPVGPGPLIDTTGYNSIVVTWSGANGTFLFQTANDTSQFTAALSNAAGWPSALGSIPVTTAVAAAGLTYVFPVTGRYFRLYTSVAGTAGPVTIYLRTAQVLPNNFQNVSQFGGTAPVTAGVAGMLAVGGNIGPGVAPTANPALVGGIDYNGLTRRNQTDANGSLVAGGNLPVGYRVGTYNVTYTPYTVAIGANQTPTLTAQQSSPNPVLIGGVDAAATVRMMLTDRGGAQFVNLEQATGANNSVVELLTQLVASIRVNNFYQAQGLGMAPDPDDLLAEYLAQPQTN